ncbi:AzlD domain-containing protein [Stenotrophomonas sp.]|uniref:AzlD domain-containing protein n=1 Tax=Stenotrophomonas sp. TaxID=69392 RepID=UPI0028B13849|nr:AzlD domain-containing protein [Stenotrophomonas sp.]
MSLWGWLLLACAAAYAIKLAGWRVPARWLESPRMSRVAGTLTIGLLASLTAMNAVASGAAVALDARLGALAVAAIALLLRLPFLLVVVLGAVAAAMLRWAGVG